MRYSSRKTRRRFGFRPRIEMLELRLAPAAGDLDLTFGAGGKVLTDFPNEYVGSAPIVGVQADGKVLVVGTSLLSDFRGVFALVRYKTDGTLDAGFGNGGRVTTDFGSGAIASSVALQADGRILVAGSADDGSGLDSDFALARYNADGSLDTSFGNGGKVTTNFLDPIPIHFLAGDFATGVAVQSDGRIVVCGNVRDHEGFSDFALARYNANGSLDSTFDGDGKLTTDFGQFDNVSAVTVQSDSKIIVAGRSRVFNGEDFALARYNANGSLDTTFDGDGKLTTDFSDLDFLTGLAVQNDGRIVVAGQSAQLSGGSHVALARYNSNGSLDSTFDGDGKVTTTFGSTDAWANRVAVQGDGKIVVAGGFWQESTGTDFALARYNGDGSLNVTFDGDGKLTTDFGSVEEDCTGLALQLDGKIVVAGYSYQGSTGYDFAVARYHGATDSDGDGIADPVDTLPTTFSNDYSDGTTKGTILDRGDQTISIVDAPNPADGVVITTDPGGGPTQARVSVIGKATLKLLADQQVIATRGSVIVDVRAGPVDADFLADNGQLASASQPTGNRLTFDPATGTFTAAATNPATIVVQIGGMQMPVAPGATMQPVQIDIKPGTFPNTINLGSNGSVPVAILSTPSFNATTVDPLTVTLAGAGVNLRGNGTPQASFQDVNGDGRLDLVVHVATEALELTSGDVQAVLKGRTYAVLQIQGSDTVRIVNGLHAAAAGSGSTVADLTQRQAQAMARHALRLWAGTPGLQSLPRFSVIVADLPGNLLGTVAGNVITVDADAAGWGWFVDRTPRSDSEFRRRGNQGEQKRMDLLSVLVHEVGHLLGHDHDEGGAMAETLSAGTRLVPLADRLLSRSVSVEGLLNQTLPTKGRR